jgi:hypothetical protein
MESSGDAAGDAGEHVAADGVHVGCRIQKGDDGLRHRPLARFIEAVRDLGADGVLRVAGAREQDGEGGSLGSLALLGQRFR